MRYLIVIQEGCKRGNRYKSIKEPEPEGETYLTKNMGRFYARWGRSQDYFHSKLKPDVGLMRRSLKLAERDLLNRPDEEDVEEDARRCRCIRVGSTSGIFAATANSERTSASVE